MQRWPPCGMLTARRAQDVKRIVANDLSAEAVEAIRRNLEFNDVPTDAVVPNQADAVMLMHEKRATGQPFHVVDLDPYISVGRAQLHRHAHMHARATASSP